MWNLLWIHVLKRAMVSGVFNNAIRTISTSDAEHAQLVPNVWHLGKFGQDRFRKDLTYPLLVVLRPVAHLLEDAESSAVVVLVTVDSSEHRRHS